MDRGLPGAPYLLRSFGGGRYVPSLLPSIHHGLAEVELDILYPHLNLDELLTFSAATHILRRTKHDDFCRKIYNGTPADAFEYVFDSPMHVGRKEYECVWHWLNSGRKSNRHSQKSQTDLYTDRRLNPFSPRTMRTRLERLHLRQWDPVLNDLLTARAHTYVFEAEWSAGYEHDPEVQLMHFQTTRPTKHTQTRYSQQIRRILAGYPSVHAPDVNPIPSPDNNGWLFPDITAAQQTEGAQTSHYMH
ncbi:MAG: hypothetical protein ACOCWQ_05425 [Nanoarchaeota archaeon]